MLVGGVDAITDNRTAMLALTAVFAAVALAMLGLAIPVTASFVIGWVIIGPALLALDVPAPAAAMFVFYYSVLSEVTPPTALAAVGASAVTGGRAIPTMWQTLRYAAPAFLVPIAFVLTHPGEYLLGRGTGDRGAVGRRGGVCGHRGPVLRRRWLGARRRGGGTDCPASLAGAAALLLLFLDPVTIVAGLACLLDCSRVHRSSTRGDRT